MNTINKTKIALLERGLKPADVAAGTGLDLGYVYNLLSGSVSTRAGRKKIEKFVGVRLWPEPKIERPGSQRMSEQTNPRFSLGAAPEAAAASNPLDPTAANECIEWVDLAGKLGFTVVAVQAHYCEELWAVSGFEKSLGRELTEANLGHLDSVKWFNPITFFFYVNTQNLAAGLLLIKARLAAIGLLPRVKIGCADQESRTYRTLYPEAEKVGT